jgi:MATE family multidrug resistance protein
MYHTWKKASCYGKVFRVCFPLVMSMSATTVMEFTDRVFLSNYSVNAISAVAPAGITAYLFMAFLGGVAGYSQVFIAQYYGAGQNSRIGSTLWQGIYFSLCAGIIFLLLSWFAAKPIFSLAGHPQEIITLEVMYFNILCRGAVFHVAMNALSAFFTGRGITRPVMIFHVLGMLINIPLDYALIFGAWGFPELGIQGAALATVASWLLISILLILFIFTPLNVKRYSLLISWKFDKELFLRFMRFGIPGSLQFTLDILAFTVFILLVGRIGKMELAATNIVISINALAFMPSMGVSQGVSALVGQALGKGSPGNARSVAWSSLHLLLIYIFCVDMLFVLYPERLLMLFIPGGHSEAEYGEILRLGIPLLRIVSVYLVFDAMYMVFSGVLKGAGDTRFIMWCIAFASFFCMIAPIYLGITYLNFTITQAWYCVLIFIAALFLIVVLRYRQGKWQKMLVIERTADWVKS